MAGDTKGARGAAGALYTHAAGGPPLDGQPLSIIEAAATLTRMLGAPVAPGTVRAACANYRHRWEGRQRDDQPVNLIRAEAADTNPQQDKRHGEIKCQWWANRGGTRWGKGTSAKAYLVDGDPRWLKAFADRLTTAAKLADDPKRRKLGGRPVGSASSYTYTRTPRQSGPRSAWRSRNGDMRARERERVAVIAAELAG